MFKRLGMLLLALVLVASMALGAQKKRSGSTRSKHYTAAGKKSRMSKRGKSAKRKGLAKSKRSRSGIAKSRRAGAAKKHRHA
jgi:hypothetical protein